MNNDNTRRVISFPKTQTPSEPKSENNHPAYDASTAPARLPRCPRQRRSRSPRGYNTGQRDAA